MKIVDAHHHLWDLDVRDQPWISDRMLPIRRSFPVTEFHRVAEPCGVVGSILVQCVADLSETSEYLALAAVDPLIMGVVGYVDLAAADVGEQLDRLRDGPGGQFLAGIRHVVEGEPDPCWMARSDVIRGLREVANRELTYDVLVRPDQVEAALTAVDALPAASFVLDHLGKPPISSRRLETWSSHLRELARRPNVTAKLSGLLTEADWAHWTAADLVPYVDLALEVFGPDRLMFGSDWPVCLLAAGYAQQLDTISLLIRHLSDAERTAIFHDTAIATYGSQISGTNGG